MHEQPAARHSHSWLSLAAYFIIPAVGIPLLWGLFREDAPTRWIISGLLALFALLFVLRDRYVDRWRSAAWVYTLAQTLIVTALLAIPPHQMIATVLFFALSAEVTMMYQPRVAAVWIGVFSLITLVSYTIIAGFSGLISAPIYVAGYIFFALFARQTANAEQARAESDRLLRELQEAHDQLQTYAAQAEELAVQQERNRLAREMHDTLGHRLTVSSVQLQAAQRLIPSAPERAGEMVGAVLEEIREGLRELRRTVATLRAPVEADLALGPALKRLAGNFEEATGIAVHLALADDLPSLSPSQRHALYRGAQEGLTNVQKHASAQDAWIELARVDGVVALHVRDNGVGVTEGGDGPAGFGLHGLRERAAQLGGNLAMQPAIGGGIELVLTLPVSEEQAHE